MNLQLQAVLDEFNEATRRLQRLAQSTREELWTRRPDPDRWSMSECVAHLNLTSTAFVPLIQDALDRAQRLGRPAPKRYRRDFIGWLLWKGSGPPVRTRVKTAAPFVPQSTAPLKDLVGEFARLNEQLIELVRRADGLPLTDVTITSPFNSRMKYNAFSGLTILPRHEHRHLWQAEQVSAQLGTTRA